MWHNPWLLLISVFFIINKQLLLYQELQIKIAFWYVFSFLFFTFSESFQTASINMIAILMMSTKLATPRASSK